MNIVSLATVDSLKVIVTTLSALDNARGDGRFGTQALDSGDVPLLFRGRELSPSKVVSRIH